MRVNRRPRVFRWAARDCSGLRRGDHRPGEPRRTIGDWKQTHTTTKHERGEKNTMFEKQLTELYEPGKVNILGLTGQAGAGKTNCVAPIIVEEARRLGIKAHNLGLDAFFILSSRERKAWIT